MSPSNVVPLSRPSAPLHDRSDDDLMTLAKAGARDAFSILAERHHARLARYCTKMLGQPAAGEETAQETWLAIWVERASYVARGKFLVLLYTIARNRCRNFARDGKRRGKWFHDASSADVEAVGAPAEQLDELIERERQKRVHASLDTLPEKLREALILRFSEGLDYPQMAAILDVNESTLRSRVFHAMKSLKDDLDKERR